MQELHEILCKFIGWCYLACGWLCLTDKITARANDVLPNIHRMQAAVSVCCRHSITPGCDGIVCCCVQRTEYGARLTMHCQWGWLRSFSFICPWWPWPLILTFKLSQREIKHVFSVKPRLHDTAGCQTGCTTGLTTGCIHDTAVCQTGCQTGLTTCWMFVYTIQPVVKPVWQPVWQRVWQPVVGLSCIQTFTRLSNRIDNRLDNRLYRVNGA